MFTMQVCHDANVACHFVNKDWYRQLLLFVAASASVHGEESAA